jgi:hypothetical protein
MTLDEDASIWIPWPRHGTIVNLTGVADPCAGSIALAVRISTHPLADEDHLV